VGTAVPVLLATSHGTSDAVGQAAVIALVQAVTEQLPEVLVRGGYVDVQQPDVPDCLASLPGSTAEPGGQPVIIVPLLLSAGFHVHVDLAEAAAEAAPRRVSVTGALGPDRRLAVVLARRLAEAGLAPGDHVVLAAAGSTDQNAVADCHQMGEQLAAVLARPVTVSFISAALPRVADAVNTVRSSAPGARVAIATYLLAPGYFADLAHQAGADLVSDPLLLAHETPAELAEIVIDRYRAQHRAQHRAEHRAEHRAHVM
jgi:sirohydrochlorin ferrochelatase